MLCAIATLKNEGNGIEYEESLLLESKTRVIDIFTWVNNRKASYEFLYKAKFKAINIQIKRGD